MNNSSTTKQPPNQQPISLDEAKDHLSVAQSDTTLDAEIRRTIPAAREQWETDTQAITSQSVVTEQMAIWPIPYSWRFFYRPILSVESIQYFDIDGNLQTLAADQYSVDMPNYRIFPAVGVTWPTVQDRWDAITIDYTAGQTSVSENAKQAILLQTSIMFDNRDRTKDLGGMETAYNAIVERNMRGSYP